MTRPDDSIRGENRAALAARRPDLLARIESEPRPASESPESSWRVETLGRGAAVLVGPEGPVTSRYDAGKEAAREAQRLRGGPDAVVLIAGLGLGDLARAVLEKNPGVVLLYEPSIRAFHAALCAVSLEDLLTDPRIVWVVGSERPDEDLFLVVSNLEGAVDPVRSHHLEIAALSAYSGLASRLRGPVEESWARTFGDILTSFAQEALWFENAVRNLRTRPRLLTGSIRPLEGEPAILVAAGPSLAKNIEDLRPAMGRIPIFAVDTALRALAARGIRPDVAVSVDGNALNESDLEGLPEDWFHSVLLASDVVAGPRFFTSFDRTFAYRTRNFCLGPDGRPVEKPMGVAWMLEEMFPGLPSWQSGGSVATNALSLLVAWGADPVVFVGQDLAYSGGLTHAPDVAYEEAKFASGGRFFTRESVAARTASTARHHVPAWGGEGTVPTSRVLRSYLRWFESTKSQGFGKNRRWIDATEGGARKRGFVEQTLRHAIESVGAKDRRGVSALRELAERSPIPEADLAAGLARLVAKIEKAGAAGSALLARARRGDADFQSTDALLAFVRTDAALLEGLVLRHLRAAWRNETPGERAALVGKVVEEAARYALGRLAAA